MKGVRRERGERGRVESGGEGARVAVVGSYFFLGLHLNRSKY